MLPSYQAANLITKAERKAVCFNFLVGELQFVLSQNFDNGSYEDTVKYIRNTGALINFCYFLVKCYLII